MEGFIGEACRRALFAGRGPCHDAEVTSGNRPGSGGGAGQKKQSAGISVGDDKSVSLGETDLRRGDKRLSGVRLLHTHPNGSILPSDVDLNSLHKMRYDAMVVVAVTRRETFTGINGASASVLCRNGKGELEGEELIGPYSRRNFKEFDRIFDLLKDLDKLGPGGGIQRG